MKKTKQEINKLIDDSTLGNKKYEIETYEKVINKAFLPKEISMQERMRSNIDLNNKKSTIQKSSFINDLSNNLITNSFNIITLFIKSNYIWMIIIPLISMLLSFIVLGVVPGEHGPLSIEDPIFVGTISANLYLSIFFIPTLIWMLWVVPLFVLSMREDNYISRIKMKGYSEIQILLSIFIISIITIFLFQLILIIVWLPITYQIGLAINDELSSGFFNLGDINYIGIFFHDLSYLMIMSIIGITIGFKSKNAKIVIFLITIFMISGLFFIKSEIWYYGDESPQDIIIKAHNLNWLCFPFTMSNSILYDMVTLNVISEFNMDRFNNIQIIESIIYIILPISILLFAPKKIVSYKPVNS